MEQLQLAGFKDLSSVEIEGINGGWLKEILFFLLSESDSIMAGYNDARSGK